MKFRNCAVYFLTAGVTVFFSAQAEAVVSLDLGEIIVTPSRIAQHGYKIASNVSVIDQKQIQASNARNVSDILTSEMGIHIYDNGTPKTNTVDIRGFGDTANRNVLVLVNDRKINLIDNSGPDLLQIPLESVERIEIIRGAGSVLYGDNAVGGVINIITKHGKGDLSGRVGAVGGSYKTSGVDLEASGSKFFKFLDQANDVSYYLYSKYYDEGGYRKNSDMLAKDYINRFGYKLSDKLSVDLEADWHEDDYGLPGGLNQSELDQFGRKGTVNPKDFARTKDRSFQLGFDYKPWPEDVEWGRFVLDLSYRNRDTFARFGDFDFNTKRSIDAFGINTKYIFDHTIFNKEFNFVAGIDHYDTDNDILGSGTNSDDLTISKIESGYYLFSEYEMLDNIFVNAGTRFQQAEYVFDQRQTVRAFNTQSPDESVNSVGMKYEYAPGSNVFFDVQQTFRFLSTDEWYNNFSGDLNLDLKQQTGIQYETGWQHNYHDKTIFSVTPYLMDIKNEIFLNPDSGFLGSNDNYDKTRRVGVEIGQKTDLLKFFDCPIFDQVQVSTNYTYQDPEFLKGPNDGKQIPMTPRHQVGLGIQTGFLKRFGLSFDSRYVGSQFAINDTSNITPQVKPYFVADSKLTYKIKDLEMFFVLNNIFNEKYYSFVSKATTSTSQDFYPAPERNFRAGFNVRF